MKPFLRSWTIRFNAALALAPFLTAFLVWLQAVLSNEEFLPALTNFLAVLGMELNTALASSVVMILIALIGTLLRKRTTEAITFNKVL